MQGEHPAQLKKHKMLTSAVLLPFGGFLKCPLLLPLGGSRLPAHNRGSAGPTWGSLSWGTQRVTMTQPAPSNTSRTRKKQLWKAKVPNPASEEGLEQELPPEH